MMKASEVPAALSLLTKPERINLILSISEEGLPNVMPAGWVMRTSNHPPLIAVSVGLTRYTHELIGGQKEFVVAVAAEGMEQAVRLCGGCSGRETDKIAAFGLRTSPASVLRCPLLEDAAGNLECVLHSRFDTGDHTIFVGRVVAASLGEGKKALFNFGDRFSGIRK